MGMHLARSEVCNCRSYYHSACFKQCMEYFTNLLSQQPPQAPSYEKFIMQAMIFLHNVRDCKAYRGAPETSLDSKLPAGEQVFAFYEYNFWGLAVKSCRPFFINHSRYICWKHLVNPNAHVVVWALCLSATYCSPNWHWMAMHLPLAHRPTLSQTSILSGATHLAIASWNLVSAI